VGGLGGESTTYGERVEDPDALADVLLRGLEAVNGGRTAIVDVVLSK
jgi:hypothetical protein